MIEIIPHDWKRIANDKNEALIHMFVALTSGCKDFHFPKRISENFYKTVKQSWINGDVDKIPLYLQGFVGGVAGFRGSFFLIVMQGGILREIMSKKVSEI